MESLTVGCVQMRSTTSVAENCENLESQVRAAAAKGAKYIQTPEMTGLLERRRAKQFAATSAQEEDVTFGLAQKLAKELGIWLHIGSTAIALGDEKLANRAAVFSPDGELLTTYDKLHMFDVDLDNGESWRESKVYAAGSTAKVVDLGGIRFGMSICYDVRFPDLYKAMALAGAQILTCPAAFTRQTGQAHWHTLLRSRAIENGSFVIAAAQGGLHEDGRETFGHSLVVNPWGKVIAELEHDEPGILVCELDLGEVEKARSKIPNLKNGQSFNIEVVSSDQFMDKCT